MEERIELITKEELKDYYKLVCEIRDMREKIKELQSLTHTVGAVKFNSIGSGNVDNDAIGKKMAKLDDLMQYYVLKLEERIIQQEKIEKAIENLPVTERRLMRYRYIDGLDWRIVAAKLNYSLKQTHRIHGRTLQKICTDNIVSCHGFNLSNDV